MHSHVTHAPHHVISSPPWDDSSQLLINPAPLWFNSVALTVFVTSPVSHHGQTHCATQVHDLFSFELWMMLISSLTCVQMSKQLLDLGSPCLESKCYVSDCPVVQSRMRSLAPQVWWSETDCRLTEYLDLTWTSSLQLVNLHYLECTSYYVLAHESDHAAWSALVAPLGTIAEVSSWVAAYSCGLDDQACLSWSTQVETVLHCHHLVMNTWPRWADKPRLCRDCVGWPQVLVSNWNSRLVCWERGHASRVMPFSCDLPSNYLLCCCERSYLLW